MSTWEDRMAARAAERAARRKAEEAGELPEAMDRPGHEGHHWHVRYGANYRTCSCGETDAGCWTVVPDERCWSDDPAEVAQMRREDEDFQAWVTCLHCGETGVTADDVMGTWPPRKVHDH